MSDFNLQVHAVLLFHLFGMTIGVAVMTVLGHLWSLIRFCALPDHWATFIRGVFKINNMSLLFVVAMLCRVDAKFCNQNLAYLM